MISFYNASEKIDQSILDYLRSYIDNYIVEHRCCNNYPNCTHPKEQTDANLLHGNDEIIDIIRNDMFDKFKMFVQQDKLNITYLKCWALKNKGSSQLNWHKHNLNNSDKEISFIMYLSDTTLGTEFETNNYKVITKPKKFTWIFFNSDVSHQPQMGIEDNMRYVLAGAIGGNYGID
jgi:hypothetical protein